MHVVLECVDAVWYAIHVSFRGLEGGIGNVGEIEEFTGKAVGRAIALQRRIISLARNEHGRHH